MGRWVRPARLGHVDVEDVLYAAAEKTAQVVMTASVQPWATIRSGLSAGLQDAVDLTLRTQ